MWRVLSQNEPAYSVNLRLSEKLVLQTDPEVAAAEKTLVVAFTGLRGEMMLPLARFTSSFDPKQFDFLIVFGQYRTPYTCGVRGLGTTFQQAVRQLEAAVDMAGYAMRSSISTSNGGFPALELAEMLQFESGFAIGGRDYRIGGEFIPSWLVLESYPQFLCECTASKADKVALSAIFSQRDEADSKAADVLQITRPDLALVSIPGAKDHNPFPSLAAKGQVRSFFRELNQAMQEGRRLRPYSEWARAGKAAHLT